MPHLSEREIDQKVLKALLRAVVFVLADCKDKRSVATFLDAILTPTEKIMIAKRLGTVIMLEERIPTTRIDKTLKITRMTIGKIKLMAKAGSRGYEMALKKLEKKKEWKEIKRKLLEISNS